MPPQHKALLIGASEYDDPRILDLPFVPDDLQRMRDALVERGFQSAEIVESKRGITPNTVNSRIRTFLRDADRGDTLFILLSGHGQHFKGSDYLIPEDATFDVEVFAETCIEIGWERELEESHATHVVFLVDACREGIDLDTMAPPGLSSGPSARSPTHCGARSRTCTPARRPNARGSSARTTSCGRDARWGPGPESRSASSHAPWRTRSAPILTPCTCTTSSNGSSSG